MARQGWMSQRGTRQSRERGQVGCGAMNMGRRNYHDPVNLLAFDTAAEATVVGLQHNDQRWAAVRPGGAQASAHLLPAVQALLQQADLAVSELDAIAFGAGPGSFTGVRTACSAAQGLALGIDRPVIALDTLMALAETACDQQCAPVGTVASCAVDARMGEIYWARYLRADGRWQVLDEPQLLSPVSLLEAHAAAGARPAWCCGPGWREPGLLSAWQGRELHAPDGVSAQALLRLAVAALASGQTVDAAQAEPRYVRNKVAQTTDERARARLAA